MVFEKLLSMWIMADQSDRRLFASSEIVEQVVRTAMKQAIEHISQSAAVFK